MGIRFLGQSSPSVRVVRTSAQAIANSSVAAISWQAVTYGGDSMWTVGDPTKVYAPISGIYLFSVATFWASNATGKRVTFIQKNAVDPSLAVDVRPGQSYVGGSGLSSEINMNAGDYLIFKVFQDSGGSLNFSHSSGDIVNATLSFQRPLP